MVTQRLLTATREKLAELREERRVIGSVNVQIVY